MGITVLFRDRREAGRLLASYLREWDVGSDPVVVALPRGGVPVGFEVARALRAPLIALPVRKLALPEHRQLVMGAVAPGGVRLLDQDLLGQAGLTSHELAQILEREQASIVEQSRLYATAQTAAVLYGRTVVVVDDGLTTGFSLRAAVVALKACGARHVIAAVPVGTAERCDGVASEVDALICPNRPKRFRAAGWWYRKFRPVSDETVCDYLFQANAALVSPPPAGEVSRPRV